MPAEAPAMPPKPNTAAIMAITRNINAHRNMKPPSTSASKPSIRPFATDLRILALREKKTGVASPWAVE